MVRATHPPADDKQFLSEYFASFVQALALDAERLDQLTAVRDLWQRCHEAGGKVIFVGNGGSAGMASHLAVDLNKNGEYRAVCFNDAGLITCLANDYGYERWVEAAIRMQADPADVLVAISSSGGSANILRGVEAAREKGMKVVTLSGFSPDNPLRRMGDVNLWLDSRAYNIVESTHQFWMMSVIDLVIGTAEYPAS